MEMARRRLRHRDDRLGTELDFYMPFNSTPPVLALSRSLYSIAPWLVVRGVLNAAPVLVSVSYM